MTEEKNEDKEKNPKGEEEGKHILYVLYKNLKQYIV